MNVFGSKVLIEDFILTSPSGDGTAILRGHPIHAKTSLAVFKAKGVPSFLSYSRPWVVVRPRELNPRPPAQQSRALPIELQNTQLHLTSIRWCKRGWRHCCSWRMLFGGRYFSSHLIRLCCFQGFVRFWWWKSNWSVSYLIQKHPIMRIHRSSRR